MATSDLALVKRVPCRLIAGPTSLSLAAPTFGGTELGLVRDLQVRPNQVLLPIHEEPYGEEIVDALDVGSDWTLEVTFRTLDATAVAKIFPATETGATSGKTGIAYPGGTSGTSYRAGRLRSAAAVRLLVVPFDTGNHPCLYFPNALPIVAGDAVEEFQVDKELVVHAFFHGTRDPSGRLFLQVRLEDLAL